MEVGRAGRDGEKAHATLFFNNTDVKQSTKKKHRCVDAAMKEFCILKSCRKEFVINYFSNNIQEKSPLFCYDQCDKNSSAMFHYNSGPIHNLPKNKKFPRTGKGMVASGVNRIINGLSKSLRMSAQR